MGGVLLLGMAAAGWVAAGVAYALEEPEHLYQVYASLGAVVVMYVIPWLYGEHRIRAYTRLRDFNDAELREVFAFCIRNDGAGLRADQYVAHWPGGEVVVLTCTGDEQEPRAYPSDLAGRRLVSSTGPDLAW